MMNEISTSAGLNKCTSTALSTNKLQHMFRDEAENNPDAIAVSFGSEQLTYSQLYNLSMSMAGSLAKLTKQKNEYIGVYLESSIELMTSVWGIVQAGSAYIPLSTEYPDERIKYMIKDSGLKYVVSTKDLAPKLEAMLNDEVQVLEIEELCAYECEPELKSNLSYSDSDIIYVIYTSGTTGKPKGVLISNASITNQMKWLQQEFKLDGETKILQKTPTSFDAAQWELLSNTCGTHVVMANSADYKDPDKIIEQVSQHRVTHLQCVPTLFSAILDSDNVALCNSLEKVFCGGEALAKHLVQDCHDALPHVQVINLYGPTECTINSSFFVANDPDALSDTVSIGKPVGNMNYCVLDKSLANVKQGEVGELHISGVGLAVGYLNRQELTNEKFISVPGKQGKFYKSGDLVYQDEIGNYHFVGRTDNQVKLRGYRVELDEIRSQIETHPWVNHAALLIKECENTKFQTLHAFVELNPKESALMDQGNHGQHHLSKSSRTQAKMQLANASIRNDEIKGIKLSGHEPSEQQTQQVYSRKTYRFFDGGKVNKGNILDLLACPVMTGDVKALSSLTATEIGELLRYFGQFHSKDRLLPKYGYASPGALYATQMYIEVAGIDGFEDAFYYYHPIKHELVKLKELAEPSATKMKVHFVGHIAGIEPIYKNNIAEVLEIEAGHMLGLFEYVLPQYGLGIRCSQFDKEIVQDVLLNSEDLYLGSFDIDCHTNCHIEDELELYVQVMNDGVNGLQEGLYSYQNQELVAVADEYILKKETIAINQAVYDRSSFGVSMCNNAPLNWLSYIQLGRKLQLLQMNDLNLGLMSSGYSSKSGNPLPSSKKIKAVLGKDLSASYFAIGGKVSQQQRVDTGMSEDVIHMKGPLELLKDDLNKYLPHYMRPNNIFIIDKLPLTLNGKVDTKALSEIETETEKKEFINPKTSDEIRLHKIWKKALKKEQLSLNDNFFECGGNSLIAVRLINQMNETFGIELPMQVFFEAPTIMDILEFIYAKGHNAASRLIEFSNQVKEAPIMQQDSIYCWPGLGGYCMNLLPLAKSVPECHHFYGVQSFGVNPGEEPYETIGQMAHADIELIKQRQPTGPYRIWGYSFGARVAFEVAYQLEQMGEAVSEVVLIAPGSPRVDEAEDLRVATYTDRTFVTILYSVFMKRIEGPQLERCIAETKDRASFIQFINAESPMLSIEFIGRVINIVEKTYEFKYTFEELNQRSIKAPISVFKAIGDDYSFIEQEQFKSFFKQVHELACDHYQVLSEEHSQQLVDLIASVNRLTPQVA